MTTEKDAIEERFTLQKQDPPAMAAFAAAACVADVMAAERIDAGRWPTLFEPRGDVTVNDTIALAMQQLAPFARANPLVPIEALYRHAAGLGMHDGAPNDWTGQSLAVRAAFCTFADVLLMLDRLREDDARLTASQNPQVARAEFIPIEDTILRTGGDATDLVEGFGADRKVTIIPASGQAPGHVTAPRPAPPSIETNVQRSPGFMPPAAAPAEPRDSPPVAGAPALGNGLVPGGAVPLGHGFDPDVPFNPEGTAPAQGSRDLAADAAAATAIATPPATPLGADDPLGVRNAPESGGKPPAEPEPEQPGAGTIEGTVDAEAEDGPAAKKPRKSA